MGTLSRDIGPIAQDMRLLVRTRERKTRTYLVWVPHQHIFSLRLFHAQIDDRPHNPPPIGDRDVKLTSEV